MGYSKETFEKANEKLSLRRQKAFYDAEKRREEIYKKIPRVYEIEKQLAHTGLTAAKAVLSGSDTKTELIKLKDENLKLQGEMQILLVEQGYTTADLDERYICPLCRDHGYIDGIMCGCMKKLLRDIAFNEVNALSPLSLSSFDTFDLSYYPNEPNHEGNVPRVRMTKIFDFCKKYAENFNGKNHSILMLGGTGLGKTHLSLAIAGRVIERGFGVIYCSTPRVLSAIEREHFTKGSERATLTRLEQCDLLIIDDLGTEFGTQFNNVTVYNLLNNRILCQKPTIVNTNLSTGELKSRYTERFVSRLIGEEIFFEFIGKDIRLEKKRRNSNSF